MTNNLHIICITTVYFFISRQCKLNLTAVQMEKSNTLAYAPKTLFMEEFREHKSSRKRPLCVHLQRIIINWVFCDSVLASCAETSQEHFIHYQIMSLPSIRQLPETSRSCVHRTKRRSAMSRRPGRAQKKSRRVG